MRTTTEHCAAPDLDERPILVVGTMRSGTTLLDRVADAGNADQMAALTAIFERSTQYEVAFWDMAHGSARQGEPTLG